jgi:heme ABC exporter ATP-binding subunit CcmA
VTLPAVQLNSLYRSYGRQKVLVNINLVVNSGRILRITGGNGAGKTTLLRILATGLQPSKGTGLIYGANLVGEADKARRRLLYLGSASGNSPILTARENLSFSAKVYGAPIPDINQVLEVIGLTKSADRTVRTFSTGMKKRLGIGRLLLIPADLWLLDEPYAGLDQEGTTLVNNLLFDALEDGKTVIFTSHALEDSPFPNEATLELVNGRLCTRDSKVNHV